MARYVCPEGDYEQDTPGVCPNHEIVLEEVMDETAGMSEEGWEEDEGMEGSADTEETVDEMGSEREPTEGNVMEDQDEMEEEEER